MYEQQLNTFLTCPRLVDFAADARLVHVVFAPSPTAYLSLVIAVGLRREGRRFIRDALGNNERNNHITVLPSAVPLSAAADSSASAAYLSLIVFVSAGLRVRREAKN